MCRCPGVWLCVLVVVVVVVCFGVCVFLCVCLLVCVVFGVARFECDTGVLPAHTEAF